MRSALVFLFACSASAPPPAPVRPAPVAAAPDHQIHTTTTVEPGGTRTRITGSDLVLADQPLVPLIGVPMTGRGDLAIDLLVPADHDARKLSGEIVLRCPAHCTIGDDHAKLHTGDHHGFGGDLEFGHLDFDRVEIQVTLGRGIARISQWAVTSPDVQLFATGQVQLAHDLDDSTLAGCLRFRPSDNLRDRNARAYAMLSVTGAQLAPDGLYTIRLAGTLGHVTRFAQPCEGPATTAEPAPERPTLTGDASDPSRPASDDAAAALADAITPVSETVFDVRIKLIAKSTADTSVFLRGARFVPVWHDGKPAGFKLYAIRPASLWAKLGFLNGDAVQSLDGATIATADDAIAAWTKISTAKVGASLAVGLERRGAPVTLTFRFRP